MQGTYKVTKIIHTQAIDIINGLQTILHLAINSPLGYYTITHLAYYEPQKQIQLGEIYYLY